MGDQVPPAGISCHMNASKSHLLSLYHVLPPLVTAGTNCPELPSILGYLHHLDRKLGDRKD